MNGGRGFVHRGNKRRDRLVLRPKADTFETLTSPLDRVKVAWIPPMSM